MRLQNEIENSLQKERAICTPVSIIVEDIKHINARLEENRYFYSDIKREGILLYDSKKYILAQPKILTVSEKKIMQQEDFETWHDSGNSALRFVSF